MTAEDLRKSILQQAIQGKLVPQDPNDEPASVLLERIREEKARLVKEKKIKKDKNESIIYRGEDNSHYEKFADGTVKCIDDEIPFDIPESWCWERWGNLSQSIQYGYNAPALNKGDIRMVRISDIQNGDVLWETVPFCNIKENEINTYLLNKNDILFARTGGTVGKSFLVKETPYPAIYAGYLIRTRYSDMLSAKYMKYFMESNLYWLQLKDGTIATAQPNCNGKTLGKMILPLPPLSEQNRIVSRIEELMAAIDKFEQSKIELDKLESELQPQLKKSILQYAIQGKLVAQNPTDEPASELLKRINEEKEQLIKAGKIKRDKNNSIIFKGDDNKYFEKKGNEVVCIDDEIPFEIPDSWEWVRMGDVGNWGAGSTPNRANHEYYNNGEILWLKTGELNDDIVYDTIEKITQKAFNECSLRLNRVGDVLIAMYGATIGKIAIVGKELTTNQACCGCSPYSGLYNRYLFYYLMANKSTFIKQGEGGAQPNISRDKLVKFLIPLPPLQEQKRIVVALDNVLASIMRN